MSVVVADTSPLNYLVLIGAVQVLHEMHGNVLIPSAVLEELQRPGAPEPVRRWAARLPEWIKVTNPTAPRNEKRLGLGEAHALALASEMKASLLLVDDRAARQIAADNNLPFTGTIGVLEHAAEQGLVDLPTVLRLLVQTNYRIEPRAVSDALERFARRRRQ